MSVSELSVESGEDPSGTASDDLKHNVRELSFYTRMLDESDRMEKGEWEFADIQVITNHESNDP